MDTLVFIISGIISALINYFVFIRPRGYAYMVINKNPFVFFFFWTILAGLIYTILSDIFHTY